MLLFKKLYQPILNRNSYINGQIRVMCYTHDLREFYKHQEIERNSREKMQAIMDAAPMICTILDKDGNCTELNEEVERMFNTTKYEYKNNFEQFVPKFQPDGSPSMQKMNDYTKQALEKGSARYEFMYQLKDGTPVPTEEILKRITINGEYYAVNYTRDMREFFELKEKDRLAQQVQAMAKQLDGYVQRQAAAVSKSSASIEQMINNTQSVTITLSKNAQNVKELEKALEVSRAGLVTVAADIEKIFHESESLLEINSVMANIASQTNLLSMNAAIEAAHAGESGRGFAVVADEIRKLAESSSNQSKTISGVLKTIKASIDKITKSTDDVMNKFQAMDSGIKTVTEQENNILRTMEEQGQGSKEVLEAIGEVNKITHQVGDASRQLVER